MYYSLYTREKEKYNFMKGGTETEVKYTYTGTGVIPCEKMKTITTITISNTITKIHDRAFYGCINLTEIIGLENVTEIGICAFEICTSLEKIILPNCKKIGNAAFRYCTNLKTINFIFLSINFFFTGSTPFN